MKKQVMHDVIAVITRMLNDIHGMTGYDWGARINVKRVRKQFKESLTCPYCNKNIIEDKDVEVKEFKLYD